MAILTSPAVDRAKAASPSGTPVRRPVRALVGQWLAHPLASFYLVLVSSALLLSMGILMVWSASSVYGQVRFDDAYYFVKRQALFVGVGVVVAWFLAVSSPRRLKILGWVGIFLALILLLLTFTPLGFSKNGNQNWLQFGTSLFRLQPSEFAKLAMVMWGADIMARKAKLLDQPKHLLIPFVPVSLLLIGLVILQRDLGTGMLMGAIMVAVLWFVGANWRVMAGIGVTVAASLVGLILISPHRLGRIFGFLDPSADPMGVNLQPMRALYALASGGLLGLGLGASRQKWGGLMESHTDYVLAVIGEELGLVGTLLVIALFLVLGYSGIRVALRSDEGFNRYCAAGITTWFMIQALVNILVVLRMIPVLGIPLPLVSYGGSSLLANMCALGVLLALARLEPDARRVLARKRKKAAVQVSTVIEGRRI